MKSIRLKITLLLVGFCAVPLLFISWINLSSNSRQLETQIRDELSSLAQVKNAALADHFEMIRLNAQALADDPTLVSVLADQVADLPQAEATQGANYDRAVQTLRQYQERHWGMFHHVFVATPEGHVILSPSHNGSDHLGQDVSESSFFASALETPQVTDFFGFTENDHYHQLYLQPVKDETEQTLGVLIFEIEIPYITNILSKEFELGRSGHIFLVTLDGVEVVKKLEERSGAISSDGIAEALAAGIATGEYPGRHGQPVMGMYLRDQQFPWVLALEIDREEVYQPVRAQLRQSSFLIALSLLLAGVLSILIGRSFAAPLVSMAQAARRIAEGDMAQRIRIKARKDEVGQLATVLNGMVDKIEGMLQEVEQKGAATESAAHEVQEANKTIQAQQTYLARNVDRMLAQMNRLAQGDLTVALSSEQKGDDIDRLFDGFNQAVTNMRQTLTQVSQATETTAGTSAKISASTEHLASASQEQSAQATEVAAAVEQMVHTIVENARNATATAEMARQNGEEARAGGRVVAGTVEKIRQIAAVVQESSRTIERLGQSSQQIGEITSVIDDIADQTNLLALNAAIEAARAGEQGRGFAVVADEVRKLAERTTAATKEIAQMIKAVQTETEAAVAAMQRGTEEVEEGIVLADQAGAALGRVVSGTEQTLDMIRQIAAASEEQSATSEQISRSVEMISAVSGEAAQGISQIAYSADSLNRLTEELRQLITRFQFDGDAGTASPADAASFLGKGSRRAVPALAR